MFFDYFCCFVLCDIVGDMDIITLLFSLAVLIISVMFHELAHGTVADRLGDPTARLAGRLTLNPLAHMELIGSFLLPLLCIISGSGFIIGWAKPIPFNPAQLKYRRWGAALVAVAGPLMNILIAVICAIGFRVLAQGAERFPFAQMLAQVVGINISLAVFNLIPIPPLDGHHILGAIFPAFKRWSDQVIGKYGLVLLIFVLLFAGSVIAPTVSFFSRLLLQ